MKPDAPLVAASEWSSMEQSDGEGALVRLRTAGKDAMVCLLFDSQMTMQRCTFELIKKYDAI